MPNRLKIARKVLVKGASERFKENKNAKKRRMKRGVATQTQKGIDREGIRR